MNPLGQKQTPIFARCFSNQGKITAKKWMISLASFTLEYNKFDLKAGVLFVCVIFLRLNFKKIHTFTLLTKDLYKWKLMGFYDDAEYKWLLVNVEVRVKIRNWNNQASWDQTGVIKME